MDVPSDRVGDGARREELCTEITSLCTEMISLTGSREFETDTTSCGDGVSVRSMSAMAVCIDPDALVINAIPEVEVEVDGVVAVIVVESYG